MRLREKKIYLYKINLKFLKFSLSLFLNWAFIFISINNDFGEIEKSESPISGGIGFADRKE